VAQTYFFKEKTNGYKKMKLVRGAEEVMINYGCPPAG